MRGTVVLGMVLLSLELFRLDTSLGGEPSCPAGQKWLAAHQMCMPVEPEQSRSKPGASNKNAEQHGAMGHGAMSNARMLDQMISPDGCGPASYYWVPMSMCLPRPRARGRAMVMPMLNAFFVDTWQSGLRGRHAVAAPNWFMVNSGVDLAAWNRLELDVMLTAELWTVPGRGYPELLQIGEHDAQDRPYIDGQHPHSSPLMGLTLTDVISFSATKTRLLRLSFAPRGFSSDGPIPFMHRPSAMTNPDAPLGHHVGQDAGHITSTVFSAAMVLGDSLVELSTFNGREPEPAHVDLPLAAPDSFATRLSQQIGRHLLASVATAYVSNPETHEDIQTRLRFSASFYTHHDLPKQWRAHSAWIWGGVLDSGPAGRAPFLNSLLGEVAFVDDANAFWSRVEILQRTAAQLAVDINQPSDSRWVGALTAGYTRKIVSVWVLDFSVGASGSMSIVSEDFIPTYGGRTQLTGRLFLQGRGGTMWHFGGAGRPDMPAGNRGARP